MGAISSCFGRGRSPDQKDDETQRLLQGPYQGGYGGISNSAGDQPNSEAARREREALEGIYHSLSDGVFDVFSAQPHSVPSMSSAPPRFSDTIPGNQDDLASEEMRLRTIKKGRSGPVFSSMNKSKSGMSAVQAAIG